MNKASVLTILEASYQRHNTPTFIKDDPIQIPHRYSQKQDIEIAGLFAALLAWGQRKTIINKCSELMERMGNAPYKFITEASDEDLSVLEGFKHRTFNDSDLLYFISFLQRHYVKHESLEDAFCIIIYYDIFYYVTFAYLHFLVFKLFITTTKTDNWFAIRTITPT